MKEGLILFTAPASEKELVLKALKSDKVGAANIETLAGVVSAVIEQGIFYLGINKSEADRSMLKMVVINDCQNRFFNYGLDEVKLAIENGYRGKYGEVYGMAPKDINNWLLAYRNDELRRLVKKEIDEAESDDFKKPDEDEQRAIILYTIERAWHVFIQQGYYRDSGNLVYNSLTRNGKISFTPEERQEFKKRARAKMLNDYTPEKYIGNPQRMQEARKMYEEIKADESHALVIAEAKNLALNQFFSKMVVDEKTIYDLFKIKL